jgi:hypothetical protein
MRYIKQIPFVLFVIFFRAGGGQWTSGINALKGAAGITLIEWALVVTSNFVLKRFTGDNLLLGLGKYWVEGLVIASFYGNYHLLVTNGFGTRYEREFSKLERSDRRSLYAYGFSAIGITIGFLLFSLFELS